MTAQRSALTPFGVPVGGAAERARRWGRTALRLAAVAFRALVAIVTVSVAMSAGIWVVLSAADVVASTADGVWWATIVVAALALSASLVLLVRDRGRAMTPWWSVAAGIDVVAIAGLLLNAPA